ncbi:MAG TPA: efflux RND transporter periplasmic adaptor subunit, partial [Chitinophagaceae bacterium]|nr:efflux RND transporter periplasmic adaptor subunit [Chitinophagaceae bacterium]
SKHQLEFLKSEFDRQKELMKENINSVKAFEKAQAEYKTEWGKKQALAEKLKLYHTDAAKISADNIRSTFSVHAPITGFIHTISVNIGSFAEPNKQLFELVDNRFLHIDLTIFEKDISKVREGQKITFTDANDASHLHNATIFSINKAFESGQQAVIAHASIDSISETLLPGMFIEARIKIDDSYVDALPSEAIVSNGNDHYIFIEEHPATYRQVAVKTGTTDLNYTEIKPMETVDPNKKIVVKGAYYLLSELTKGEGEHEQ